MGVVFRALDTRLNRLVALKLCHDRFSERFQREVLALSGLNHPHICTLFDAGQNYLVMEYLEGSTLAARILQALWRCRRCCAMVRRSRRLSRKRTPTE
jgi:eukaryotic-like serine/threonine-protein kinase